LTRKKPPKCQKCREEHTYETRSVVIGRRGTSTRIREYAMKRLYVKGKVYSCPSTHREGYGHWTPVGWICPNCLAVIVDQELIDEAREEKA